MRKKEKRERSFKDNTQNKHATLTTRSVKDIQRYQKNKKKKKTEYGIQIWRDLDLQDGKNKIEENKTTYDSKRVEFEKKKLQILQRRRK